jgi:hypothetical protein
VNPAAPSPQIAKDRLAEKFDEFSQGLAAQGGGRISQVLIGRSP